MKILTFKKGGVHPNESKFTKDKKIEEFFDVEEVLIPLHQHTGAPNEPLVKQGDYVKIGQKIGETHAKVYAPVHSSISGEVKGIENVVLPTGRTSLAVRIKNDGKNEVFYEPRNLSQVENLTKEELLNIIKDSGIVGMGGAAFPTHIKLSPPPDKKIEYLIINGAECEPFLTCDYRLMIEESEGIVKGIEILNRILNPNKIFIGIEDNKIQAAKELEKFIKSSSINNLTEIIILKTKYPQGSEKHLIKAITGREVPSGGLPFDVGCIVQNVQTVFAIKEAIYDGKPSIERVLTISGSGIKETKNLRVKIGTIAEDIIKYCGGFNGNLKKIIFGGPMMGFSSYTLNIPVTKGTSGILLFTDKEVKEYEEYPCIRCGRCADACPMSLMPMLIDAYSRIEVFEKAKYYGALDCIECGACAYVCPSKRHLVQSIRFAKSELLKKR
ncbi:MAG: electron transport complex subunit RsxC [Caldisericia bacterium]|jgi:electron transport complex protein RnfC|nr:electron transport complex subunit RsxC [Caldisericia bacterium]